MSDKREDTMVAGFSMGGYGAVKAALTCPETFGACASLSGSIDIASKEHKICLDEMKIKHCYEESEGDHTWPLRDLHIQDALKYFLG